MNFFKGLFLSLLLLILTPVQAALDIRITQGVDGAIPIAIAPFLGQAGSPQSSRVADIVTADLKRSGRFSPLPRDRFAQPDAAPGNVQLYLWREKSIDYLVVGKVEDDGQGQYRVTFQLLDSAGGKQLAGYSIPAARDELRMAAHQISDLIYEALLGVRGAFNTRIAYITTKTRHNVRSYVMQVADSDGYNSRTILSSSSPLMSPDWSPDNQKVAYVSFENNRSSIYVQDVVTGSRTKVSNRKGINGAPAWSPDGTRLAITLSEGGSPNIYVLDLSSKRLTKISNDRTINTEPVWMPDGSHILFTSSRSGKPQIYKVSASGGSAQRVTFEGDYNSAPSVSPDGRKIAMVNGDGGRFRIAVLDLDSGETRVVTNGTLDESPSFAPNGDMIIYATESGGRGVLAAVSADGRVRQTLLLKEGEVREPDWSNFLN
ncbi:MAG TPA: Tol-Pal system beta propeller repeat protein TolB [Gammaproteobacteria bacterium]|nr:Tol-Pal system beta propeller repeat protein TolB [Gammaproteobacteria bacterium]